MSQPDAAAEPVLVEHRSDKISVVTLNRPERLNASNAAMTYALLEALAESDKHPDTNVIVLTGAGRAFSAGGDIEHMQTLIDRPALFMHGLMAGKRLIASILDCPKPVIAKVNGAAVGLGATIALFCDIIIAAHHAKIGDPHVKVGFTAGDGGAVIWPLLIGYARAK